MKKWTKKILVAVLCLMMLQMPGQLTTYCGSDCTGSIYSQGSQGKKRSQKRGRTILLLCEGKKSKEYMENRDCR